MPVYRIDAGVDRRRRVRRAGRGRADVVRHASSAAPDPAARRRRWRIPAHPSHLVARLGQNARMDPSDETDTRPHDARGAPLGPLESQLMSRIWQQGAPVTVRDLCRHVPALAYTTVMTTVARLHRKGLLLRRRCGRAFVYEPRWARGELAEQAVSRHVASLLTGGEASATLLSAIVQSVGQHDEALLDELEALVKAERERRARERDR
ncbi:MAG: BlaI/MecI/CopY family transcriptional regulator [Proteobacteria bacterium]|nr:BlaI/MecI/CopY family transcriptional regulator [Pseudomonadota bacterium]